MSQTNTKSNSKPFTLFIFAIIFILPFTSFADKFAEQQGVRLNSGNVEIFKDSKKPIPLENQIVERPTEPTANLEIKNDPETKKGEPKSQPRIDEIGVFVNDENKANLITKTREYIKKYSKGEPILDAEMVVNTAQKSNFPLDLILIQAHTESHFCTNGRAIQSKNCWNVGNFDGGDNKPTNCQDGQTTCLDSYQKGLDLYIRYMESCHFHENETISVQKFFDRNFSIIRQGSSICGPIGARYATDVKYRQNLTTVLQTNFNPIFTK
jgi:hypothetical protein